MTDAFDPENDECDPFESDDELDEAFELGLLKNPDLSDADRQSILEMDDD